MQQHVGCSPQHQLGAQACAGSEVGGGKSRMTPGTVPGLIIPYLQVIDLPVQHDYKSVGHVGTYP